MELFEMRPVRETPAHQTGDFAELVCSNSLKSDSGEHSTVAAEGKRCGARVRCCCRLRERCAVPARARPRRGPSQIRGSGNGFAISARRRGLMCGEKK